jgi:hypothetical protein
MLDKIAITSAGPYAGATTIGKELADWYGYQHITMSDYLILNFAQANNLNPDEVREHKKDWRKQLQAYGDLIELNNDSKCGYHVHRMLVPWDRISPVVIEKVRSDSQAACLKNYGFTIVHLEITEEEREYRALNLGVTPTELHHIMEHHIEKKISQDLIDITLDADDDPGFLATWLAMKP